MNADRKSPNEAASSSQREERRLVPGERPLDRGDRLGDRRQDPVAGLLGERRVDAAGDDPRGMDPLAAEPLDDLLAEAADADAVAGQSWGSPGRLR